MLELPWLDASYQFPPLDQALTESNGLLAAGGDLSLGRLLAAYRLGIFPWYEAGQPILWWSPSPRCMLKPAERHVSRSLRKLLARHPYRISFDQAFAQVVHACAAPRAEEQGTWITHEMSIAYQNLHHAQYAHSVEVWDGSELVGGLYGLALGGVFFGESMFSRVNNSSKLAFSYLCAHLHHWGYQLIDCQVENPHLLSLGAYNLPHEQFQQQLAAALALEVTNTPWQFDPALDVLHLAEQIREER